MDKILKWCGKVPAGLMLIPLVLGALVHTFCPAVLEIGSFTTAVFSHEGHATLVGLQLLCLGSWVQVKAIGRAFGHGGALLGARVLGAVLALLLFRYVLGTNVVLGVCVLTVICAISNTNGSIYMSLCHVLEAPEAVVATPILALTNGPMLPLLLLGVGGFVTVTPTSVAAMVVPMALGMILGNISQKCADFLKHGVNLLLPFIGFSLGAGIDLLQVLQAGLSGLVLSVVILVAGCLLLVIAHRACCKGDGAVGIAAGATGGNGVAVPAAMALADPTWEPFVATATAQIATCAIVSAIFIPILALWWHKKHQGMK